MKICNLIDYLRGTAQILVTRELNQIGAPCLYLFGSQVIFYLAEVSIQIY